MKIATLRSLAAVFNFLAPNARRRQPLFGAKTTRRTSRGRRLGFRPGAGCFEQLDQFLDYLVDSPYMDMLTEAGYGVGQGTATPGYRANVSLTGFNQISDVQ